MKKLLAILGAVGLTATGASVVVSCGNGEVTEDKVDLSKVTLTDFKATNDTTDAQIIEALTKVEGLKELKAEDVTIVKKDATKDVTGTITITASANSKLVSGTLTLTIDKLVDEGNKIPEGTNVSTRDMNGLVNSTRVGVDGQNSIKYRITKEVMSPNSIGWNVKPLTQEFFSDNGISGDVKYVNSSDKVNLVNAEYTLVILHGATQAKNVQSDNGHYEFVKITVIDGTVHANTNNTQKIWAENHWY
ncbi:lipoprotein [Mesoplasma chauliocola]|uniref:lipoprotein n=1 Tax=Mesoplasma chauliocola TaxID=216427 RepID=UPI000483C6DD|nr:lipoprotein [Mesoplasma chauliocola]